MKERWVELGRESIEKNRVVGCECWVSSSGDSLTLFLSESLNLRGFLKDFCAVLMI